MSDSLTQLSNCSDEAPDFSDIELIQHINLDLVRLVKLLSEITSKFRSLNKYSQLHLMRATERAIWNWMDTYPQEFMMLQVRQSGIR